MTLLCHAAKCTRVPGSPLLLHHPLIRTLLSCRAPSRDFLQAGGAGNPRKRAGCCPAVPRSFVVVFKGLWAMSNRLDPFFPLPKCKLYGSNRGQLGLWAIRAVSGWQPPFRLFQGNLPACPFPCDEDTTQVTGNSLGDVSLLLLTKGHYSLAFQWSHSACCRRVSPTPALYHILCLTKVRLLEKPLN